MKGRFLQACPVDIGREVRHADFDAISAFELEIGLHLTVDGPAATAADAETGVAPLVLIGFPAALFVQVGVENHKSFEGRVFVVFFASQNVGQTGLDLFLHLHDIIVQFLDFFLIVQVRVQLLLGLFHSEFLLHVHGLGEFVETGMVVPRQFGFFHFESQIGEMFHKDLLIGNVAGEIGHF